MGSSKWLTVTPGKAHNWNLSGRNVYIITGKYYFKNIVGTSTIKL